MCMSVAFESVSVVQTKPSSLFCVCEACSGPTIMAMLSKSMNRERKKSKSDYIFHNFLSLEEII